MSSPSRFWCRCLCLAGCLLLTGALAAGLIAGRGTAGEPSRAAYDQIKMGMVRQEAEAILGDWPRQLARSHRDSVTVGWEAPDGATIEVDFNSDGRVTGKHFAESDQSLPERIERIIKRFPFH